MPHEEEEVCLFGIGRKLSRNQEEGGRQQEEEEEEVGASPAPRHRVRRWRSTPGGSEDGPTAEEAKKGSRGVSYPRGNLHRHPLFVASS